MPAEPAVLARNTSYLTLALIAQKVISFLYFTFLARTLGPTAVGRYVLALAITTIFSTLLDVGLSAVLTREVARDQSSAPKLVRMVLGYKVLATALVISAVVLTVHLLGYPQLTRELAYIACGVMVLDSFILTAYSTIRGFQTLVWESLGTILVQLVISSTGLVVAQFTNDLRYFMVALLFGATVHAGYAMWRLKSFGINLRPSFSLNGWRELLRLAWPFAVAAILLRVYSYLDSVLLSKLADDHAVGIYSVAYKVTFALQFIPSAFSASLLPGFSSYFRVAPEKLAQTFIRGVVYLTAISVPISLGAIVVAPKMIAWLYPAFSGAVVPLQILMASLPFLFMTFPVGALLPACNRQERNTLNIAMATAASVILNVMLIPRFGPMGAAIASLISTLVLLSSGWVVAKQLTNYDSTYLGGRLWRIALSGAGMSLAAWLISQVAPVFYAVLVGAAVYATLVVLLRGVPVSELKDFWQILLRKQTVSR